MANTKKKVTFSDIAFFLFFAIFPLGQLLRFRISFLEKPVSIHPIDLIVSICSLSFILKGCLKKIDKRVFIFFYAALASLFLSLSKFNLWEIIPGFLYLIRFFVYFIFIFYSYEFVYRNRSKKELLFSSLYLATFFTAIFGWFQYLFYPDLKFLKYLGWDDHFYRLVGTFLDPVYIGLILNFGGLISLDKFVSTKKYKFLLSFLFFILTLALTYSRISFLSFIVGTGVYLTKTSTNFKKFFFYFLFSFLILLLLLPRPGGEGVRLERTASIFARIRTFSFVYNLFNDNPLFGIGFNNLCSYRVKYLEFDDISKYSNSCYGVDSSISLILTASGVIGFLSFLTSLKLLTSGAKCDPNYQNLLLSIVCATFIHSLFSNSLFYSFILGFNSIFLAISFTKIKVYSKE